MADSTRVRTLFAAGSGSWQAALARLRRSARRIVEATIAAVLAWLIAVGVFSHPAPFFAPAAALIAIGVTRGQRIRRAIEVIVGVALGVLMADVLAKALAPHLTLTIALITGLTLVVATLLDGGPILSVQAAVSGIYVAVVASPSGGVVPPRFVDALVGGGVALGVNQLPLRRSLPDRLVRGAAPVFRQTAEVLEAGAAALAAHNEPAARAALERARTLDASVAAFAELAAVEAEMVRFDPIRRRQRELLRGYEQAGRQLDMAVRNVRVLARAGVFLTRGTRPAPAALPQAVETLAEAVRALGDVLAQGGGSSAVGIGGAADRVVSTALTAVRFAVSALDETSDLPVVMVVGQVRATAIDLLVGSGMALRDVLVATDEALGQYNTLEA